jgi:hypothetical protein
MQVIGEKGNLMGALLLAAKSSMIVDFKASVAPLFSLTTPHTQGLLPVNLGLLRNSVHIFTGSYHLMGDKP